MDVDRVQDDSYLRIDIPKLFEIATSKSKRGEVHTDETSRMTDSSEVVVDKVQDLNRPKLTIGMFFEFMKLAHRVNDNCENLITILTDTAGNKFDWSELAKIDLGFGTRSWSLVLDEYRRIDGNVMQNDKNSSSSSANGAERPNDLPETLDIDVKRSASFDQYEHRAAVRLRGDDSMTANDRFFERRDPRVDESPSRSNDRTMVAENLLISLMKTNLSDVLHEGLFDSVLPYMIPKPTVSQPVIKKSVTNSAELKKTNSLSGNIEARAVLNVTHKEKEKEKEKTKSCSVKRSSENEVEIHVCDEEKNMKKNFHCTQRLLVQKMRYFAEVTAGQKLEEIDISVHCDIAIFDWLMRWVKKDVIKKSEWPILETTNVIPIMVSASFLQMEPLLENCLQYCRDNMSEILRSSTVLSGLDDNLLTRLMEQFTNEDVEMLKDKKDKIQSKLFCKLIASLAEVMPDNKKGHYGSLATLFKCSKCGKNIVQSVSSRVPCVSTAMKIDSYGNVHSKHIRDLTWTLNDYIVTLRTESRSWRKVYWRLWGDCHFLFCTRCNTYFPIHQFDWCCYHAELPQFFLNERQRPTPFPLGRYPCCSQRAYKFQVLLPNREGCRYRGHVPDIRTQKDISVLNIFIANRDTIAVEPPQLFFPEKITRLVARDPLLQPGKLICKDAMWWIGIELSPQRPKLGLLGKIWSESGFRRLCQLQDYFQRSSHRICQQQQQQQVSIATDTSSIASSTDSDAEDGITTCCENSSSGEESNHSEESHVWSPSLKSRSKPKKCPKGRSTWRNSGRSWSSNLNVRHNQDNQRDFEESAALQMTALLTERVSADFSVLSKSPNKHGRTKKNLNGGTYARLEAELRDQLNHPSYKNKSTAGKYLVRAREKSNKP
ncbi:uncharacterized protein KIAA1841 homolog isoform X2 [Ceratina calcarata]|uniref:Uncharacterized protein KIAA1841 homolog isoform X2 n=1 Tax=Ceratina calcarata TaxID=156304 RepID=A0AAJ7S6R9_9HYME|nr:uncharacterized protein KIAA1841 homolog isoform X2 [Ceratina calcarata]